MNNEYTISIKDLAQLFLSKLWILLIVTVLCGAAGFGYSRCMLPLEYSSHISMYVQSYTNISENSEFNQNNISNSKQLINTYIEVLKDDAVMRAVGEELQKQFSEEILNENFQISDGAITPSSLRSCIRISSVTDTSALNVNTTTRNPEVAAAICNILAGVSPEFIADAVGVGSISTIDNAKVYPNPVGPNTPKNIALAMMVGLVLSMAVIFLVDFFDNTVKDTEALTQRFEKAIIGEVPRIGEKKSSRKHEDEQDVCLTNAETPFHIVESYKSIRTNVTFAMSTCEKKVLAISSANPSEGKSTTAANVAIAAAQSGNRVLLIDADMRKSRQHKLFELNNKHGLSSAISKISKLEECIHKNVLEHLDVMTAGPIPPNPSELLSSQAAKQMFEKLGEQYALIVVDLPPICVVSDAMTLSENVAGLIMVVRYGMTTFEDLEECRRRMELANMNLLGYVLNDVEQKHGKSGYYHYRKKYGYGGYSYGSAYEKKEEAE